ncbi:MAG TPA: hypothetical protein VNZ52_10495 [Candidatus Thermoplasmatota archaeon]|nr:hypothetical protein [Candidatus Thermoplasmatota archaeon]
MTPGGDPRQRRLLLLASVALAALLLSQFLPWRSAVTDLSGDRGETRVLVHSWGVQRTLTVGNLHSETTATYFEDTLFRSRGSLGGDVPWLLRLVLPLQILAAGALVGLATAVVQSPYSAWVPRCAWGAVASFGLSALLLLYASGRLFADRLLQVPEPSAWLAVPAAGLVAASAAALTRERPGRRNSNPVP